MTVIRIVGLGGSSNRHVAPIAALDYALASAHATGAETMRFDIHTLALPMYEYGVEPPEVRTFVDAVRAAHAMIWCTPLYHGSLAGAFKNAIDWLELLHHDDPPYLTGKVIGLMATASGDQALQAVNSMEYIARSLRAWTLPLTAPILRSDEAFDDDGQPRDTALGMRLRALGTELAHAAAKLSR